MGGRFSGRFGAVFGCITLKKIKSEVNVSLKYSRFLVAYRKSHYSWRNLLTLNSSGTPLDMDPMLCNQVGFFA